MDEHRSLQLLTACHDQLKESGLYLGDRSNEIRQNVEWKHFGRCNQLVTKIMPDEANVDEGKEQSSSLHALEHQHTQATLYVIIAVSPDDCFLTLCGNWRGPTATTKSFTDVKLSF